MRVVFLEDVEGVALGGDVKEVKNGFARNYLIPKNLAAPATHNSLQRIKKLMRQSGVTRLKLLGDMKDLANELDGRRIDVEMRAGSSGRLYGSVTNAVIADALSSLTGKDINRRTIDIVEPIRDIGVYSFAVRLHPEVSASIQVVVYPLGTCPDDMIPSEDNQDSVEERDEADELSAVTIDEIPEQVTTIDADLDEKQNNA